MKFMICNFVLALISSQLPEQKEGLFFLYNNSYYTVTEKVKTTILATGNVTARFQLNIQSQLQ